MAAPRRIPLPWLKPAVLTGALVPLLLMPIRALMGTLGKNPISEALNELGLLALIFLVAAIACTPAQALLGWTWPVRVRRLLGVLSFVYALLHFLTYAFLDQTLNLKAIFEDIAKRPFILVGFLALVLLTPLAVTSTDGMVRKLGFVRWKRLHRLTYLAVGLGVLHYYWRVKADVSQPLIYGAVAAALLAARILDWARSRSRKSKPRPPSPAPAA